MRPINFISIFIFIILLFSSGNIEANKLDSLYTVLRSTQEDTAKVELYLNIIEETYTIAPDSVIPLSEKLITIVEGALQKVSKDKEHYLLAVKANCFNNIGAILNQKGDIKNALSYFHKSLKIKETLGEKKAVSSTLNNIGYLYGTIGDRDNALLYYNRSLKIKQEIGDKKGISRILNNLGSLYDEIGDTVMSLRSYTQSLKIAEELHDSVGMSLALNNIGFTYDKKGASDEALFYYSKSYDIRIRLNDQQGIAESLNNLGNIYLKNGNVSKAQQMGEKALQISKELQYPEYIKRSSNLLKDIYLKQGDYAKAYKMLDLYMVMRDSIMKEENRDAALKRSFEYEYELKTTADSIKNFEVKQKEQISYQNEIARQRAYTYGGIIGFVLMLIIAVISYKAYQQKQKANEAIMIQKKIIEEKQKEVLASINYAKRIQQSILPTAKYIEQSFNRLKNK